MHATSRNQKLRSLLSLISNTPVVSLFSEIIKAVVNTISNHKQREKGNTMGFFSSSSKHKQAKKAPVDANASIMKIKQNLELQEKR